MALLPIVEYFAYFAFLRRSEQVRPASRESRFHQSAEHEVRLQERNDDYHAYDPLPDVVPDLSTFFGPHSAIDVIEFLGIAQVVDFDF